MRWPPFRRRGPIFAVASVPSAKTFYYLLRCFAANEGFVKCHTLSCSGLCFSDDELSELVNYLNDGEQDGRIAYAICGEEHGTEGTLHLQGYIRFAQSVGPNRKYSLSFWKTVPDMHRAHLENARGDDSDQEKYCSKDGIYQSWGKKDQLEKSDYEEVFELAKTDLKSAAEAYPRMAIMHSSGLKAVNALFSFDAARDAQYKRYEGCELRSWQQKCLDLLVGQSDRKILFCVDKQGSRGKSWLARYIIFTMDTWGCRGGGIKDLMYAYKPSKYAVFDMARCNNEDYYPWNFMENLKDGWFCNLKYVSEIKVFTPPKIVVFMNKLPPYSKLSIDRYQIYDLDDENEINFD